MTLKKQKRKQHKKPWQQGGQLELLQLLFFTYYDRVEALGLQTRGQPTYETNKITITTARRHNDKRKDKQRRNREEEEVKRVTPFHLPMLL